MLGEDLLKMREISRDEVVKLGLEYPNLTLPPLGLFSAITSNNGMQELHEAIEAGIREGKVAVLTTMINSLDYIDKAITNALTGRVADADKVDKITDRTLLIDIDDKGKVKSLERVPLQTLVKDNFDKLLELCDSREAELMARNISKPNDNDVDKALDFLDFPNIESIIWVLDNRTTRLNQLFESLATKDLTNKSIKYIDRIRAVYNNKEFIASVCKTVLTALTKEKEDN